MGFNKILEKIGVSKADSEMDDGYPEEAQIKTEKSAFRTEQPSGQDDYSETASSSAFAKHSRNLDKVVDISSTAASIRENSNDSGRAVHSSENMKVVVIQPRSLDDSQQIANCLKEKRPVVINFEGVDDQLYRRILDFVSGTTYALDGTVNSISTRVWLFSPKNVNVSVSKQTNTAFTDMPWEKK